MQHKQLNARKINGKDWLVNVILIIAAIAVQAIADDNLYKQVLSSVIVLTNLCTVLKVRKNWYLLIISITIAYCNYSIVYANHWNKLSTYFTRFANEPVSVEGLNILMLFSLALQMLLPGIRKVSKYRKALIVNNRYNVPMVLALSVVLIFILVFGFTRPDVAGERGAPSTYYEYSLIIFIIAAYYTGKNNIAHIWLSVLMAAFALQNFLYGGRITGVQIIICWVLCFYLDKLTLYKTIPVVVAGFLCMSLIGSMRANFRLDIGSIASAFDHMLETGASLDTAYSAYYTSLTFVEVKGMLGFFQRLSMLGAFCLSMLLGGIVPNSNVSLFTRQYYVHYYGGVLPFYGFFYLGYAGILLLAFYLRKLGLISAKADYRLTGMKRCVTVYVTSTAFRWYLYSPSQLLRGVMILIVCYTIAEIIDNSMRGRGLKVIRR